MSKSTMTRKVAAAAAVLIFTLVAQAGDIYTWKDDTGRVQMSDVVPEKYKRTATRMDTRRFELTPEQRTAAQAQAAALKTQANSEETGPKQAVRKRAAASSAVKSAPEKPTVDPSDCAAWRRAFVASRDCYAGYPAVSGGRRSGALEACGPDIPNPDPKCGPEKWQ
jgi:hypothetical protein